MKNFARAIKELVLSAIEQKAPPEGHEFYGNQYSGGGGGGGSSSGGSSRSVGYPAQPGESAGKGPGNRVHSFEKGGTTLYRVEGSNRILSTRAAADTEAKNAMRREQEEEAGTRTPYTPAPRPTTRGNTTPTRRTGPTPWWVGKGELGE